MVPSPGLAMNAYLPSSSKLILWWPKCPSTRLGPTSIDQASRASLKHPLPSGSSSMACNLSDCDRLPGPTPDARSWKTNAQGLSSAPMNTSGVRAWYPFAKLRSIVAVRVGLSLSASMIDNRVDAPLPDVNRTCFPAVAKAPVRAGFSPSLPREMWFTSTFLPRWPKLGSAKTQQMPSEGAKKTLPQQMVAPWIPPWGRWKV